MLRISLNTFGFLGMDGIGTNEWYLEIMPLEDKHNARI